MREIQEFVDKHSCVKDFMNKYSSSLPTFRAHGQALCRFFKWLRVVQHLDMGPADFLNLHIQKRAMLDINERRWALQLVLSFSRDNPDFAHCSDKYKYNLFMAVKQFCAFHEAELTSSTGVFGKHDKLKYMPKQFNVEYAKRVLNVLNQRARTICMVMFQSGQNAGQILGSFNQNGLYLVKERIAANAERIKLEFKERKGNNFHYWTYIGHDAIQELRKWLIIREEWTRTFKKPNNSLFVTKRGSTYTTTKFFPYFNLMMQQHKLADGPYSIRSHMFRKLFKSEASVPDRGIDPSCVEFWMGHSQDIRGKGGVYDKSPELYEPMIEKEYQKLEPFLNLYTGRTLETGFSSEDVELLKYLRELKASGYFERLRKPSA